MTDPKRWMIYGATGYTGKLTVEEAVRRGHQPIVAGRNAEKVEKLALQHGLAARVFDLADPAAIRKALADVPLVLHCAGPFSATAKPMLDACLATKTHYLDITGEIDVFAACHARDAEAKRAGIVVLPGSGFDVVPTDCVAAMLKRALPDATQLVLAFEAGGGPSAGTAKSSIEGLGKGGRARRGGKVIPVPLAWKDRTFTRDGKPRTAMTIPWGDVFTAYISTGIPDIEVYMAVPPATIGRVRRLRLLRPLLGLGPVQRFMKARVEAKVKGPSIAKRTATDCYVWGEARNAAGREVKIELLTPNGYDLTVNAALGIVEHLLGRIDVPGGYYTPSLLLGAEYVLSLPGTKLVRGPDDTSAPAGAHAVEA
jgi:short subunit dehydrogenase-like uncharacterized protein